MAESSYMIAPGETSDSMSMRKKLALALAQKNMETPKIEHWAQGLAHLANQAYSGYEIGKINKDEKEESAKGNALLAALFNGGQAPAAAAPASAPDPSMRPANVSTPMGDTKIYGADELNPIDAEYKASTAPSQPRGYRNNNPLNIEAGNFTQGQPGFAGSDGRFAKFASLDQGIGAASKLLDTYEKKHGLNTIAGILSRWAPTSDGNNVSAYAANVSKQLGIDPNTPVPPEMRPKLIAAMAQHENGKPMPSMNAQQPVQMAQAPQAAPPAPGGVNKEALIQMLGNRKTAPMAQAIMQGAISKQFAPQDYDFKERPDGTLVAVNKKNPRDVQVVNAPGGGQAAIDYEAKKVGATTTAKLAAERDAVQPQKDKQEKQVADIVVQDIDRAIKTMDTAILPTTGAAGSALSNFGGTAARDVRGLIDTVKANAGFQEISKMRAASPTGAALGNVTERELALLQATVGNLEQSQSGPQFKDNLRRVKNQYLDVIHGPGKGPAREKLDFEKPAAGKKTTKTGIQWSVQ
jgi:hypothetical protein